MIRQTTYHRRSVCTALRIENSSTQIALFSKTIRQHVEQMPFVQNTEILRPDVQVLDHILTMEIKTHFKLNLHRPTITYTTANSWANWPPLPLGFRGEGVMFYKALLDNI
jgi:hypothetical protein